MIEQCPAAEMAVFNKNSIISGKIFNKNFLINYYERNIILALRPIIKNSMTL